MLPLQLDPDQDDPDQLLPLQLEPDQVLPLHVDPDQDDPDQLLPLQLDPDHVLPLQELPDQVEPFHVPRDQLLPVASSGAVVAETNAFPKMSCSPCSTTPLSMR